MIKINRDFIQLAEEHRKKLKSAYNIKKDIKDKVASESGKLKYFYKFLQINLDLILTANPSQISNKIIPRVKFILGSEFFTTDKETNKSHINVLKKIFDYDLFAKHKKKYCAYSLVQTLKINVCPYCNRQYITTLEPIDNKGGTRPTLDHFYLKSDYPYLALSFWNLIPSCYSCNSQLRGTKKIGLHPYIQGFEGILHFYTDINSVDDFISHAKKNINLKLLACKKSTPDVIDLANAKLNCNVFRLDDIYKQNHKDDVRELIQKAVIYDKSFSKSLYNQFDYLFDSEEDARKTMLRNYTSIDDLEKRPLAKLTKDICEELGI